MSGLILWLLTEFLLTFCEHQMITGTEGTGTHLDLRNIQVPLNNGHKRQIVIGPTDAYCPSASSK